MIEILIEYRSTLTAVLAALVGILGAFALQRYLSLRAAVHAYKSAFSDCLSALGDDAIGLDTFSRDFDRHKAAVDAIRPILPKRYQRKLQKAWDNYRGKNNNLGFDDEGFIQASSSTLYSTNKELFQEFKKRFHILHSCLDKLK